jgi:hypothetical protein
MRRDPNAPIEEAWLDRMKSDWYWRKEGTSAKAWRQIPRVIGCNIEDPELGRSAWADKLPVGDKPVEIMPDYSPTDVAQLKDELWFDPATLQGVSRPAGPPPTW